MGGLQKIGIDSCSVLKPMKIEYSRLEKNRRLRIRGDSPPQSHKNEQEVDSPLNRGSFEGINVTFTADTGATRTVVSTKIFRKIPLSKRPKFQKSGSLASADGQPLKELGKAVFNLTLGELVLEKELIVAEIEDEALLGLDILMKGDQGPADIKLTEGVILLNSTTIPCIQEDSEESQNFNSIRRIKLTGFQPIRWQTNEGIIRSLAKKGTAHGGKSGVVPTHLQSLYEDAANNRPIAEQKAIVSLLQKYSSAFSVNDTDLRLTHLVEHSTDTDQGIIQKSNSPWGSPLQLVVKKNGKIRPCCDYRQVNSLTRLDSFSIPRIQDCLDPVGGATLMSTFDLTSGYNHIPMKKDDISKTAFVTKYGLYEFKTMPFGVCNGPATCQRLMELVPYGLQWQICLIYLDIIVSSNGFEEHVKA
ncbi:unnamed protein product [Mytilus coruscus]|uniref:Reverse transcriptase domain-containing protein n=1 Tax=Mytilus coruscus TaxID=42192 RepID=A0A6J8DJY0_MYTCO|nr:unnamed protein product [Mytilus coruscus]